MTTHFKCASNLECIDLFLFVRFFWCFRFFWYCIFLFVLLLEQGYFNLFSQCNPLAHAAHGLGVSASCSTANNCCRGHRSRCDTATTATCGCTTGTAAAVHDAVEHAATGTCRAHDCFRCACYALVVRASCLVVRTTHILVARALSCFRRRCPSSLPSSPQLSLCGPRRSPRYELPHSSCLPCCSPVGRPPWAPQCAAIFQWATCSKCSSAHCQCSSSSKCSSSKCRLRPSK